MFRRVLLSTSAGLLGVLLFLGFAPLPAHALVADPITYRVTTTDDQVDGAAGGLSLREAVLAAADDDVDSRIVLAIGATYQLDRCATEVPDLGDQGALLVEALDAGNPELLVEGRGSTVEQTCPGEAVLEHEEYGHLTLRDLTITGGEAGGVYVATGFGMTAVDTTFEGNSNTIFGGGLRVGGGGGALLVRTTFHDNDAVGAGGGAWINGFVTVRESTFSDNGSATTTEGGGFATINPATVQRSTFSGNVADEGTAISAGSLALEAATISDDDPEPEPGSEVILTSGDFESEASIVQSAEGVACNVGGVSTSGGHNRTSDSGCFLPATGDVAGQVALEPLADNGGPTQTHLPSLTAPVGQLSVSDAIPAAAGLCATDEHDQRYVDRPQGPGCEVGAVERPDPFPDVGPTNPFFAEIAWMAHEEITTGYGDGSYKPSASVSRAAMAAFLYRLSNDSFPLPPAATFPDVSTDHPFFLEVEWLDDTGITGGYQDGTFRPAAPVTRQAMAAFVYRYQGEPTFPAPATATFPDVSPAHPFFTEVEWMADEGISSGYVDGTWRPGINVSRQAMARFLFVAWDPNVPG